MARSSILTLIIILVVGCVDGVAIDRRPTVDEILATLPVEVAGEPLDLVQPVDADFNSGHAIDDTLMALGRERSHATVVFRLASQSSIGVGGVAVDGVPGHRLEQAVVEHWLAASVTARAPFDLGGRAVWGLTHRGGEKTLVYRSSAIVYVAIGKAEEDLTDLILALP